MPVRAGWVPSVGFQPSKPMVMMIEEADLIAHECERAFQRIRSDEDPNAEHQGASSASPPEAKSGGSGTEMAEDEPAPRTPTKPAMKLLMNPKGVQDFHAVQEHYQALLNAAPPSPEVGKIVSEAIESPTGKGAELFAKRKKRMDKFIVDETTVQKAQQQTSTVTQQSVSSTSSFSSSSTSSFSTKKQAELERNKQQEQIMEQFLRNRETSVTMIKSPWEAALETGCAADAFEDKRQRIQLANTVCERADNKMAAAPWLEMPKPVPLTEPTVAGLAPTPAAPLAQGPFNLPDLTKILTQPTKSEPSKSKVEPLKSKPVPSKSKPWPPTTPKGGGGGLTQPSTTGGARILAIPPVRSSVLTPPAFASFAKPLAKTFSPPCSPANLSRVSKTATNSVRDQTGSQCFAKGGSCSAKPAENAKSFAFPHSSAVAATKSVPSPGMYSSVVFPKPIKASPNLQEFADSKPLKAFPPVVSKCKPVKLALGSFEVARVSPKPVSYLSHSAPATAEADAPSVSAGASSLVPADVTAPVCDVTASLPSALDVETCSVGVPSAVPGPNPVTATATAILVHPTSFPVPRPSAFPTDGTSSSSIFVAGPEEVKPGTPPLYICPDGTEATDLSNETKSVEETNPNQYVQKYAPGKGTIQQAGAGRLDDSSRAMACQPLTADGAAASDLQAVNTEVSNSRIVTACSSSSSNISYSNVVNTSSNSRMSKINISTSNSTSKINCTSSNYNSSRPARPTSLPLIPLSSLVNSVIPSSSPPSPCVSVPPAPPPRSPPACAAASNACSLSSSVVHIPEHTSAAFPLVCAADFGSKKEILKIHMPGSSEATTTSPTPPLPDSSTCPSQNLKGTLDFASSNSHPFKVSPQLSDVSNPQQITHMTQSSLTAHPGLPSVSQTTSGVYSSNKMTASLQDKECDTQNSILATSFSSMNSASEMITSKNSILEVIDEGSAEEQARKVDTFSKVNCSEEKNINSVSPSSRENITSDNIFQEVPDIQICEEQRKPSLDEDELRKFLSEIEHTFENMPSGIDAISVEDLKPPDFYRSVSRTSLNLELEDNEPLVINGVVLDGIDVNTEAQDRHPGASEEVSLHHPHFVPANDIENHRSSLTELENETTAGERLLNRSEDETQNFINMTRENKEPAQTSLPVCPAGNDNNSTSVSKSKVDGNHEEVESGESVNASEMALVKSKLEEGSRGVESVEEEYKEGEEVVDEEGAFGKLRESMLFTEMSSMPSTNTLPPPLSPPSHATNPAAPSAGTGAIYTAEVKVVQRASLPPTPVVDVAQHSLVDFSSDQSDKRRSLSFNLAAKGWGTYSKFYTPVTFAT